MALEVDSAENSFLEQFLDEAEKAVQVALEGNELENDHFNILRRIKTGEESIEIEPDSRSIRWTFQTSKNTELKRML